MTTAKEKMKELGERLVSRRADAEKIGAIYKFVLSGDDGGTFMVDLKNEIGVREEDGAAPCTIQMSGTDFVDLFEGRANGQALFFSQRLKVEGDASLALRLQALTDILK